MGKNSLFDKKEVEQMCWDENEDEEWEFFLDRFHILLDEVKKEKLYTQEEFLEAIQEMVDKKKRELKGMK